MTKIAPPAPKVENDRTVVVPPTVGTYDTNEALPPRYKTRANFREEEFVRVLDQHGKYAVWRKAVLCPCLNETTGQGILTCPHCDGSGFVYMDPIDIRVHMTSFDAKTGIYEKFGMWQDGNAMATVLPKYRLGYRDSVELKDSVMTFCELLKKGNRRGVRSKLPASRDSARYRIVNLTRLCFVDASGAIINLDEKVHFQVDENGWIEWLAQGNKLVADGTVLSALYDFHPVYLVVSHPHVTRDDVSGRKTVQNKVISLPIQAAVKLDFLTDVNSPVSPVTG